MTSLADSLGSGLRAEYLPLGSGSHHWRVTDSVGNGYFVTVDDLDHKDFLGDSRDSAFDGLRRALDTAIALRHEGALDFVVAPLLTAKAETVRRIGERYAVAVYPLVEGRPGRFGEMLPPIERAALVRMLARLHQATPMVRDVARPISPRLPGQRDLERALEELDVEWAGGPFSEPARRLLAKRDTGVRRLLESFERLVANLETANTETVITHGETHGGNVLRAADQLLLIDWDTVGLAPPERDLWLVESGNGDELRLYSEVSGRPVDHAALAIYRIRWQLDDIWFDIDLFRSEHTQTADTELAWRTFVRTLEMENVRT